MRALGSGSHGASGLSNLKFSDVKEAIKAQVTELTSGGDVAWHKGGKFSVQIYASGLLTSGLTPNLGDAGKKAKGKFNLGVLKNKIKDKLNVSGWVDRLDPKLDKDLLKRMGDIANDPVKLGKLDEFYSTTNLPSDRPSINGVQVTHSFSMNKSVTVNGQVKSITIQYDKNGFPDFKEHSLGNDFSVKTENLQGTLDLPLGTVQPDNLLANTQLAQILQQRGLTMTPAHAWKSNIHSRYRRKIYMASSPRR